MNKRISSTVITIIAFIISVEVGKILNEYFADKKYVIISVIIFFIIFSIIAIIDAIRKDDEN